MGWQFPEGDLHRRRAEFVGYGKLQSWHCIGVVVEEMERRGWRLLKLGKDPDGDWWTIFKKGDFARYGQGEKPWFAVCEAARKAVTGGGIDNALE